MKIKNRIFIFNTLMVLFSLMALLVIIVALVKNDHIDSELSMARLDENVFQVQKLFEQSEENLLDFDMFSESLSEYNYQLWVWSDEEIKYSNFYHHEKKLEVMMETANLEGEYATVYSWDSLTIVGKSMVVKDHTYHILAVSRENEEARFGTENSQLEVVIFNFILISLGAIVVLLGISQLFTKHLVKRIMIPVYMLVNAAKRIEEGNLKEPIVYAGKDEFEIVCTSFNQMQNHLLVEQQKNATYELARTDMITGISHDLRTPLTSVKGYIKGIKDGIANTPEKQKQYLDIAYTKASEMDALLQHLFYFSKMETGNMPLYTQVTDLNPFIKTFIEGCEKDLETKQAVITFDDSEKMHLASIDINQMQRVLSNLVENSLKYANTNFLEIKISLKKEKNQEIIEISDNGKGVDSEKLPRLFEQFYRGDESRSKSNNEGNGLGLYIAKYIVEAHGGTITAENDYGLKIMIYLPRKMEDEQ